MKRMLVLLAVLIASASVANAATVVLSADQGDLTYNTGETITLTVIVTTSDTPATLDNSILGRILNTATLVTPLGNPVQTNLPGGFSGPVLANTPGGPCTATECRAFDQIAFPSAINPGVTNFALTTVGYTASTPGEVTFSWKTVNPGKFDFFGLTNSPSLTVTIVPEPTTAAMLGLGLFGLALAGRRRA